METPQTLKTMIEKSEQIYPTHSKMSADDLFLEEFMASMFQPIGEKYLANQKEYLTSYKGEAPEDVLKALVKYAPMLVLYGYTMVPEEKARNLPQGRWKVPSQGVEVTVTRALSGVGLSIHPL